MIPFYNNLESGTLMVSGSKLCRIPYPIQMRELIPPLCIASSE